ncbi:MerR family transcriptional regulator [Streptomyces sp. NPDC051840]|uniref:HEAT repeat domain-containing protein n=1 Tax=Streptomyces sp. NPDC051840 TaxID=3154752 RepID=UPI003418527A
MLIGEVARRSGVSARMLRHYESLGLVTPADRTGGGYREYSGEDIRRIFHIESLRSLGLSLREVGRALGDPAFTPAGLVDDLVRRTQERIAAETALLTKLRRIGSAEPAGWEEVLQTVALLHGLGSESAGTRQRAALSSPEEAPVPVEALVEAALNESDPHVAGALRWALAQSGSSGTGVALLAEGLGSPVAAVRRRAARSLAGIPGDAVVAPLRGALDDSDIVVRRCAALALGTRVAADAETVPALVPTLVAMVADGVNDVDAADALRALAHRPAPGDRPGHDEQAGPADLVATALAGRLTGRDTGPAVRRRLAQALAEIPGDTASRALADLAEDEDRAVALTAAYVLTLREERRR